MLTKGCLLMMKSSFISCWIQKPSLIGKEKATDLLTSAVTKTVERGWLRSNEVDDDGSPTQFASDSELNVPCPKSAKLRHVLISKMKTLASKTAMIRCKSKLSIIFPLSLLNVTLITRFNSGKIIWLFFLFQAKLRLCI